MDALHVSQVCFDDKLPSCKVGLGVHLDDAFGIYWLEPCSFTLETFVVDM